MLRVVLSVAWWMLQAVVAGVILAVMIGWLVRPARAHDPYGAWKNPTTGASCCDNRDCRPTRARMDESERWEAWDGRRWIKIPPANVLRMKSPDGRSHLCEAHGAVFCFVPGETRS